MGCGSGKQNTSVPVRTYTLSFAWPETGEVPIKTVKFRAEFDQKTQEIAIKLTDTKLTQSRLTWENGVFTLQDEEIYDKITKKTQETPGFPMEFYVNPEGKFEELKEADELLARIMTSQKVTLSGKKLDKAREKLQTEVKSQWGRWVEMWLTPRTGTEVTSNGVDCVELTYSKQLSGIDDFLERKYGQEADNFVFTESLSTVTAVVEKSSLRPHRVRMRKNRYLCVDIEGKKIREMWEEASLTVFCWADLPDSSDQRYYKEHWDSLSDQVNKLVEGLNLRIEQLLHPNMQGSEKKYASGVNPVQEADVSDEQSQSGSGESGDSGESDEEGESPVPAK